MKIPFGEINKKLAMLRWRSDIVSPVLVIVYEVESGFDLKEGQIEEIGSIRLEKKGKHLCKQPKSR
jgi:hypothetical protein